MRRASMAKSSPCMQPRTLAGKKLIRNGRPRCIYQAGQRSWRLRAFQLRWKHGRYLWQSCHSNPLPSRSVHLQFQAPHFVQYLLARERDMEKFGDGKSVEGSIEEILGFSLTYIKSSRRSFGRLWACSLRVSRPSHDFEGEVCSPVSLTSCYHHPFVTIEVVEGSNVVIFASSCGYEKLRYVSLGRLVKRMERFGCSRLRKALMRLLTLEAWVSLTHTKVKVLVST
eukprot:TRINITY_DN11678_c0_g1_i6.p1 TRINITY_DN11678_c0_g1~~TRINITY_DN11678_c0_g1_i6.p1  ORF type:complete len:226 (+),score=3.93 TRINITY_DN11678_c0_g1_i6:47-724(+)